MLASGSRDGIPKLTGWGTEPMACACAFLQLPVCRAMSVPECLVHNVCPAAARDEMSEQPAL